MEHDRVLMDPVILMCAFRYALGRRSYLSKLVADHLIEHRDSLRADWRAQIARDIDTAIARGRAGMPDSDASTWRRVREVMIG